MCRLDIFFFSFFPLKIVILLIFGEHIQEVLKKKNKTKQNKQTTTTKQNKNKQQQQKNKQTEKK